MIVVEEVEIEIVETEEIVEAEIEIEVDAKEELESAAEMTGSTIGMTEPTMVIRKTKERKEWIWLAFTLILEVKTN